MMNTVQQMSSFEFQMVCVVRLLLASVCGFAIGIERTNRLKDAGMRTHLIVCMGAALMMLVSKYGFFDVSTLTEFFKADVSRVASSVVAGIGFLGAGIIFERNRSVTGLTTAAGIWTTAGIGMAMGAGMYLIAVAGTMILITAQSLLHNEHIIGGGVDVPGPAHRWTERHREPDRPADPGTGRRTGGPDGNAEEKRHHPCGNADQAR